MEKIERQSNFELLRIVSMVLIVAFHVSVHGNWDVGNIYRPEELTFNTYFLQCLLPFGKTGVNLFVLISGYFLIQSTRSTWPKLVKLWIEMLFYSIAISVAFALFDGREYTLRDIVWILTPTISYVWWFASTYMLMLALSPFINKALHACDEKTHLKLIIGLIIIWSVIPSALNITLELNNLLWFITLYVIASYLRLYPHHFRRGVAAYLSIALLAYIVLLALIYLGDVTHYTSDFWNISDPAFLINLQNSMLILILSVSIFLAFSKMNIGHNKIVNAIAGTTFGVYLIHDHDFVRWKIYSDVFDCFGHTDSDLIIPYVLFMVATIFIACAAIDFLRHLIFDKLILRNLPENVLKVQSKIDAFIDRKLNKDA